MSFQSKYGMSQPANWQELESPLARSNRGLGLSGFKASLIRERGNRCERCKQSTFLHLHHVVKQRVARHLRFEPMNCRLLCQLCHHIEERDAVDKALTYDELSWIGLQKLIEGVDTLNTVRATQECDSTGHQNLNPFDKSVTILEPPKNSTTGGLGGLYLPI